MQRRRFLQSTGLLTTLALTGAARLRGETTSHPATSSSATMKITRNGSQPSMQGPAQWFTGDVRVDPMFQPEAPARTAAANVNFDAGARTAWHTHPLGQTIVITSGLGWVQIEGGPIEEVRPGDIVWFPPHVNHWHGASAQVGMTHIAIQEALDGKVVEWGKHVTDDEYLAR